MMIASLAKGVTGYSIFLFLDYVYDIKINFVSRNVLKMIHHSKDKRLCNKVKSLL